MRKSVHALALLIGLFSVSTAPAEAAVIFNNFGNNNSYDPNNGWAVGPTSNFAGMGFTPANTFTLDSIAVGYFTQRGNAALTIDLTTDNNNHPDLGSILEQWTFNNIPAMGTNNSPLTANSVKNPKLTANTLYWLVGVETDNNTQYSWGFNVTNDSGRVSTSSNGGTTWTTNNNTTRGAFRLDGTAAPEPSSLIATLGALSLFGFLKKKRV